MVQLMNEYKVLVVKYESKTLLGRPGRRWEGDIEVGPKEIVWDGMNLIRQTCGHDNERSDPNKTGNYLNSRVSTSFPRTTLIDGVNYTYLIYTVHPLCIPQLILLG
jgi:hypothetical protein